jgi:hypothetical protein
MDNTIIYIWNINGTAVANIKRSFAKIKYKWNKAPDAEMTIDEFQRRGGQVRVINGKLFYGLTDEEKKQQRIQELHQKIEKNKKELSDTDYIIIKIYEGVATREEYEDIIQRREQLRIEINNWEAELKELEN